MLKEALKLRGIATSSSSTFPMPNATVEDDAQIRALFHREAVSAYNTANISDHIFSLEGKTILVLARPAGSAQLSAPAWPVPARKSPCVGARSPNVKSWCIS